MDNKPKTVVAQQLARKIEALGKKVKEQERLISDKNKELFQKNNIDEIAKNIIKFSSTRHIEKEIKKIKGLNEEQLTKILAKLNVLDELLKTQKAFKIDIPRVDIPKDVRVNNLSDIKIPEPKEVRFPEIKIPKSNLPTLRAINKSIKDLQTEVTKLKLPEDATNPISVRLSDGEKFYKALEYFVTSGGNVINIPKVTLSGGTQAVSVVNPDGTNVGSVSGGGDVNVAEWGGTATTLGQKTMVASVPVTLASNQGDVPISNAGLTELAGAIDGAEVQVDIISSALPTGAATSVNQTTIIGHIDGIETALTAANASLDAIEASTAAIDIDTTTIIGHVDGIETVLSTINTNIISIDTTTSDSSSYLSALKDTVFTDNEAWTDNASAHLLTGGIFQSVPQTITDGRSGPFNITANGALHVSDAAGSLTVDGTVTANLSAIDNAVLDDIAADTESIKTAVEILDNAISGSEMQVDVVGALPAGTNAIGKLAANSGVDIGDVDVTSIIPGTGATNLGKAEDAAHTSADIGVMSLGIRTDSPNAVGAGTTGDYSFLATDMVGGIRTALYETDFAVLGTKHVKKYYTNAGAVTDGIIWSPAAGTRWYVTDIFINVSAAATVTLEDDLGAGDSPVWKAELAANSGWTHPFATPLFSGEDAADLLITTSAGNVYVMVTGYEI